MSTIVDTFPKYVPTCTKLIFVFALELHGDSSCLRKYQSFCSTVGWLVAGRQLHGGVVGGRSTAPWLGDRDPPPPPRYIPPFTVDMYGPPLLLLLLFTAGLLLFLLPSFSVQDCSSSESFPQPIVQGCSNSAQSYAYQGCLCSYYVLLSLLSCSYSSFTPLTSAPRVSLLFPFYYTAPNLGLLMLIFHSLSKQGLVHAHVPFL